MYHTTTNSQNHFQTILFTLWSLLTEQKLAHDAAISPKLSLYTSKNEIYHIVQLVFWYNEISF